MEIKRDELFHFVRWLNLLIGVFCLYLFVMGGGHYLLSVSVLNIAIWAFTRKQKENNG